MFPGNSTYQHLFMTLMRRLRIMIMLMTGIMTLKVVAVLAMTKATVICMIRSRREDDCGDDRGSWLMHMMQ